MQAFMLRMMNFVLAVNNTRKDSADTIVWPDSGNESGVWAKWSDAQRKAWNAGTAKWIIDILYPILNVLNTLLVPVIIVLGVAGSIYAIVLGVNYSKAESADKREEAKKRLINAVIGVVIILVALIGMKIFIANAPEIFGWVNKNADNKDVDLGEN